MVKNIQKQSKWSQIVFFNGQISLKKTVKQGPKRSKWSQNGHKTVKIVKNGQPNLMVKNGQKSKKVKKKVKNN